jgi:aldose 1-epimerase
MDVIELETATSHCTVASEAGGRLLRLEARDAGGRWRPLLLAPDDPDQVLREPTRWGAFPMVPWPNRITEAQFRFDGKTYRVPPNSGVNAIHGVGFDRPWSIEAADARSAVMSVNFDERWPFGGGARHTVRVLDDGVALTLEVFAGDRAFPAGAGWHPWLRRDVSGDEPVSVQVDAGEIYELAAMIPTGRLTPVSRETDLRTAPELGDRRLDTCYRHPRGPLRIAWGAFELTITSSANVTHAVVYTPERAVCVEPQTCAIDAFNLDTRHAFDSGTAVVEPGRPLIAETTWRWSVRG